MPQSSSVGVSIPCTTKRQALGTSLKKGFCNSKSFSVDGRLKRHQGMPLNFRVSTLRFLVLMKRSIFDLLMFQRFVRQLDSVAADAWIERLSDAKMILATWSLLAIFRLN